MESVDWAALDQQYQEYCKQCQAEGKVPQDFHIWLLGKD